MASTEASTSTELVTLERRRDEVVNGFIERAESGEAEGTSSERLVEESSGVASVVRGSEVLTVRGVIAVIVVVVVVADRSVSEGDAKFGHGVPLVVVVVVVIVAVKCRWETEEESWKESARVIGEIDEEEKVD